MAEYIPISGAAQVTVIGNMAAIPVSWGFTLWKAFDFTETECGDVAAEAATAWDELIQPITANNYALTRINVRALDAVDAPSVDHVVSPSLIGALLPPHPASHTSLIVKFVTEGRGRSKRGRVYLPGTSVSQMAGATTWNPATAAAIATVIQTYIGAVALAASETGSEHVIASRYANGAPRLVGVVTQVTGYTYNPKVGTQRRRISM